MNNLRKFSAAMGTTIADVNTKGEEKAIDIFVSMTLGDLVNAFSKLPDIVLGIEIGELFDVVIANGDEEALKTFVERHPEFDELSEEEEQQVMDQLDAFFEIFGEELDE